MWQEVFYDDDELMDTAHQIMMCMDDNYDDGAQVVRTKHFLKNLTSPHVYHYKDQQNREAVIGFKKNSDTGAYRITNFGFSDGEYSVIDGIGSWVNSDPQDQNVNWARDLCWSKIYEFGIEYDIIDFYALVPKAMNRDPRINAVWSNTDTCVSKITITEPSSEWKWEWKRDDIAERLR